MILCIADILNADETARLCALLDTGPLRDGRETAGWHARLVKKNKQLAGRDAAVQEAQAMVTTALERHEVFRAGVLPRRIHTPLLVRYEPGMEYGSHVDDALMSRDPPLRTDVAVTVFLGDPDSYEGGELVLETAAGDQPYKLPPGAAVVYPATSLHHVAPVTAGVRKAAVTWVQSLVRAADRRELLFDLERTRRALFEAGGKTAEFDLLSKSYANLLRMWAEP